MKNHMDDSWTQLDSNAKEKVADTPEHNMVGRKVRVALDGPRGKDGATITINGWVTGQYVEGGDTEDTAILIVSVSGPILGI